MRYFLSLLLVLVSGLITAQAVAEVLRFDKSPYGLLFVEIKVNGLPVRAMIDFGDPYVLQLASSFLVEQAIPVEPTGKHAYYADGTRFELTEGTVQIVEIGGQRLLDQTFGSAAGEIDSVALQVGTPFQAAIGWGFFGTRIFLLDYSDGTFRIDLEACPSGEIALVERQSDDRYLIMAGRLAQRNVRFLIDTGSPVNVVHTGLDYALADEGRPANIQHFAGIVPGTALVLSLAGLQLESTFEQRDLSSLEPLDVQAILGSPFLSTVNLCHDPDQAELRFYRRDDPISVKEPLNKSARSAFQSEKP